MNERSKRDTTDPGADSARPENYDDAQSVACSACMKEVPRSEADTVEGPDYVWYFCGLECFERWRQDASAGSGR